MAMVGVIKTALLLLFLSNCSGPLLVATIAVSSVASSVLFPFLVVSPPLGVSIIVFLCPVVSCLSSEPLSSLSSSVVVVLCHFVLVIVFAPLLAVVVSIMLLL